MSFLQSGLTKKPQKSTHRIRYKGRGGGAGECTDYMSLGWKKPQSSE